MAKSIDSGKEREADPGLVPSLDCPTTIFPSEEQLPSSAPGQPPGSSLALWSQPPLPHLPQAGSSLLYSLPVLENSIKFSVVLVTPALDVHPPTAGAKPTCYLLPLRTGEALVARRPVVGGGQSYLPFCLHPSLPPPGPTTMPPRVVGRIRVMFHCYCFRF